MNEFIFDIVESKSGLKHRVLAIAFTATPVPTAGIETVNSDDLSFGFSVSVDDKIILQDYEPFIIA